jgi:parvulin-like peptidyl-prolyl isomerase
MNLRQFGPAVVVSCLVALQVPASAQSPAVDGTNAVFAIVNGQAISQKSFEMTYANYMRQTYYHRQVPEAELPGALEAVKNQIFDRILLLDEAKRRNVVANEASIARTIAEYDARYVGSPRWKENRDTMLVAVRQQLAEQSLLEQIEKAARHVADPTDEVLRDYYAKHLELFTEPEKMRMHSILLKVDPSASKATWDAARVEAQRILNQIKAGTAFADLARLHSSDPTSAQGGDMGYLHKGMIPDSVQEKIEASKMGEVTPPIDVLEGVALFRMDERVLPKVQPFDKVKARSADLYKREQSDILWGDFRAGLRKAAKIEILIAPQTPRPSANR